MMVRMVDENPSFYLSADPCYTIFDSMRDSIEFMVKRTLTAYREHLMSKSSFVDVKGDRQGWHGFGDLEGPGWAANAIGGAYELYLYASFIDDLTLSEKALLILDHVLEDGFIDYETGFITPYRNVITGEYYLNYAKNNDWICTGSMAKMAYQLLIFSDVLADEANKRKMREVAAKTAMWIDGKVKLAPNGWYPRRSTAEGLSYDKKPDGGNDPIFDQSGDGLFTVQLMCELTRRKIADYRVVIRERVKTFIEHGGLYGSINHDTFDKRENVSYAVAFRTLRLAGKVLDDKKVTRFAYENSLAGLEEFEICEDRNSLATKGLLYMEESWDTAYLWENAEVSLAYLEAYEDTGKREYLLKALTVLRAIAKHHHGSYGFLTEGVDWNNHVGAKHHIGGNQYEDIKYTEPMLNNLHITEPTLYYLNNFAQREINAETGGMEYYDNEGNKLVTTAKEWSRRLRQPVTEEPLLVSRYEYQPRLLTSHQYLEELVERCRSAGITHLALIAWYWGRWSATPEQLRRIKEELENKGIRTWANVMPLGHPGTIFPPMVANVELPEHWNYRINANGEPIPHMACPSNPQTRREILFVIKELAGMGFRKVLLDDDFRLGSRGGIQAEGCYCDRCISQFKAEYGYTVDRNALRDVVEANDRGSSLLQDWHQFRCSQLTSLLREIREGLDQISENVALGVMWMRFAEDRYGVDLNAQVQALGKPRCVRIGEEHFWDRDFEPSWEQVNEALSIQFHLSFCRGKKLHIHSETSAITPGFNFTNSLSPHNLVKKAYISVLSGVDEVQIAEELYTIPDYFDALAQDKARLRLFHSMIPRAKAPIGSVCVSRSKDTSLFGELFPFPLTMAIGIPTTVSAPPYPEESAVVCIAGSESLAITADELKSLLQRGKGLLLDRAALEFRRVDEDWLAALGLCFKDGQFVGEGYEKVGEKVLLNRGKKVVVWSSERWVAEFTDLAELRRGLSTVFSELCVLEGDPFIYTLSYDVGERRVIGLVNLSDEPRSVNVPGCRYLADCENAVATPAKLTLRPGEAKVYVTVRKHGG